MQGSNLYYSPEVPLVTNAYLAFKGWALISGWFDSASAALGKFSGRASAAAVSSAALTDEGVAGRGGVLSGLATGATGAAGALSDLVGPLALVTTGYLALSTAAAAVAKKPGVLRDIGQGASDVL